jgi:hypothetical protein
MFQSCFSWLQHNADNIDIGRYIGRIRQRSLENEGLTRDCGLFLFYMYTRFAHNSANFFKRKHRGVLVSPNNVS